MFELPFFVLVSHFIGDYPLQGNYLSDCKSKNDYLLFAHATIWAGCICAVLFFFGELVLWKAMFLLIGHFVIDRISSHLKNRTRRDSMIDQLCHMIQLVIVIL